MPRSSETTASTPKQKLITSNSRLRTASRYPKEASDKEKPRPSLRPEKSRTPSPTVRSSP
ncbi:UNVERIFIED_CONTAM: hypothetical protein GTU68_049809 [Idotea baltica]|nr:hypothetical protein [Idotea baltica]